MSSDEAIAGHYGRGSLFDDIAAALAEVGIDIERASVEDLVPLDHFHGRGVIATEQLANALSVGEADHILDIGCGIGGPARYMARRFGCRVTGIDLTPEFCDVARRLGRITGLEGRVDIHEGSALDLPFPDDNFDGAYCQNVSMNITDRARQHAEAFRVIRPGGFFALSDLTLAEPGAPVVYPTPWSSDGTHSFLETADETRNSLSATGFEVVSMWDNTEAATRFYEEQRERVEREGPPKLGVHIIMGADFKEKQRNTARNVMDGHARPIEFLCRKPA